MLTTLAEWCTSFILVLFIIVPLLWQVSKQFRFYVKITLYYFMILLAGCIGFVLCLPFGVTTDNHFRVFWFFRCCTGWTGITYELRNGENLISDKPYILAANHQSSIDVLGMAYFWPKNCTVMLKKSLMYIPGFNFCALLCNAIFVDRFNRKNAIESCDLTLKEIKEKNVKVWIFPEGTRNTDDTFLPFKKGAFHLAQQAKIPIVPVVFSSYKPFYDKKNFKFVYGGKIIAEALPPIDSSKYADVTSLAEATREKMLAVYPRLSVEAAERMRLATESKTK